MCVREENECQHSGCSKPEFPTEISIEKRSFRNFQEGNSTMWITWNTELGGINSSPVRLPQRPLLQSQGAQPTTGV